MDSFIGATTLSIMTLRIANLRFSALYAFAACCYAGGINPIMLSVAPSLYVRGRPWAVFTTLHFLCNLQMGPIS